MPKILLGVHLFPLYLLRHLAAASSNIDHPTINHATFEEVEDAPVTLFVPLASSVPPAEPQDNARPSHFPLFRHLAAAAMLR
ncbi:hypothetical protein C8R44DRAFT_814446 [Mycena epipterygia]|nr:hypothetical protein C8R44DRAFT_814446 [Mycena epipterygia]